MTSINRSVYSPAPQVEQNGNPTPQDIRDQIARSLLGESFSKPSKVIVCISETVSNSPLCNAVGICYLASASSSEEEARSEGVYISEVLFSSEVRTLRHSGNPLPGLTAVLGSAEVGALLDLWNTFFSENPDANLLQCFCGDAGHVVAHALQLTRHASRITVVGVNSPIQIPHPACCLFRTLPNLGQCDSRESHPNAGTIKDPAIAPALLKAFYETLMASSRSREQFPVISEKLQAMESCHHIEQARFFEAEVTDSDWCQDPISAQNSDPWAESRLSHLLNLCLASLRVVDYIYLGLRATSNPSTTTLSTSARHSRSLLSIPSVSEASAPTSVVPTETTSKWAMTTMAREYPQYIFPCGIFPNGTFPDGLDPFDGTYSEGNFPYKDFFSGDLLKEIYNCTVYFDFNVTTPFPYGMSPFGVFLPENNATHTDWPYQCRGWVAPENLTTWWMPFDYIGFFGGSLIGLEDPGEIPLFPCGIRPNGSFTGAFLNVTVEEEYPYGKFPDNDFPYLSYFFNSSFNYGGEYDRNPHNQTSQLAGSHDYFNSSLTTIRNCTEGELEWLRNLNYSPVLTLFEGSLSGSGEGSGYYENMTYSGYGSGEVDLEWFRSLTNRTLPEGYFFYGCDWDYETTTNEPFSTALTSSPSQSQIVQAQRQLMHSTADCRRTEADRVLLLLTGYWMAQGICEAILLRTSSHRGRRKIRAISLALTSSLIIGNVADLASNLWDTLQGGAGRLCTSDIVIRGSLCTYDVINLTSEVIRFASPSIHEVINKARTHSIESLPIIEKTTDKVKEGLGKVDKVYRKNARKTNLILSSVGMVLASAVALGSGISIFTTKDKHDSGTYFLTIQSLAVATFSALLFRTYRS